MFPLVFVLATWRTAFYRAASSHILYGLSISNDQMIQWFKSNDSNPMIQITTSQFWTNQWGFKSQQANFLTNQWGSSTQDYVIASGSFKLLSSCFLISLVRVNFKMFQEHEKEGPHILGLSCVPFQQVLCFLPQGNSSSFHPNSQTRKSDSNACDISHAYFTPHR